MTRSLKRLQSLYNSPEQPVFFVKERVKSLLDTSFSFYRQIQPNVAYTWDFLPSLFLSSGRRCHRRDTAATRTEIQLKADRREIPFSYPPPFHHDSHWPNLARRHFPRSLGNVVAQDSLPQCGTESEDGFQNKEVNGTALPRGWWLQEHRYVEKLAQCLSHNRLYHKCWLPLPSLISFLSYTFTKPFTSAFLHIDIP